MSQDCLALHSAYENLARLAVYAYERGDSLQIAPDENGSLTITACGLFTTVARELIESCNAGELQKHRTYFLSGQIVESFPLLIERQAGSLLNRLQFLERGEGA